MKARLKTLENEVQSKNDLLVVANTSVNSLNGQLKSTKEKLVGAKIEVDDANATIQDIKQQLLPKNAPLLSNNPLTPAKEKRDKDRLDKIKQLRKAVQNLTDEKAKLVKELDLSQGAISNLFQLTQSQRRGLASSAVGVKREIKEEDEGEEQRLSAKRPRTEEHVVIDDD